MDTQRLTWNEIAEKYLDPWIGLSDIDWEDDANIPRKSRIRNAERRFDIMNHEVDYNAQARTNPVFLTAKTAICLMARAGIPNATEIVYRLELEDNQSLQSMADSDTILGNAIVVEAKYRTMCRLIENSGYRVCVDLPCGYTPKALHLTQKGLRFFGLDLPIVVQEVAPIIRFPDNRSELVSFCEVDATNYESLATALRNIDEPLCIATEGMMMYFTENEVDTVIANVRNLLEVHGGCWITPDPEVKLQFIETFRSVFGESSLDKLTTTGRAASKQSGGTNLSNSFILDAADVTGSRKTAEALLAKHGLKAERINLAEHMPELSVYRQLTSEQIMRFKEAMNHCNYWIITLDDMRKPQARQKQRPFEMSYTLENGILRLTLRGRVDSISAPKILTTWESEKIANVIDGVELDCSELEYISSAGVRVLSNIHEDCKCGVELLNINTSVSEILVGLPDKKIFCFHN